MLGATVMGGGLTSCSDSWLDVDSKTESNTGNFYKTTADAESALIGCYSAWRRTNSDNAWGFYICSTLMSDECFAGTGTSDAPQYQVVDRFDLSQYSAGTSLLESAWDSYYRVIYRCNELIRYNDNGQIQWDNAATQGRVIGEAKLIRAITYFEMVRLWERIPLLLEPTDNPNVPQAEPDDTYAAIIADMKFAAENIPADAYPRSAKDVNDGRMTAAAAKGMLARVYLFYSGYYGKEPAGLTKAEVTDGLGDIITSGDYKLENYADLWPAASQTPKQGALSWEKDTYKMVNDEVILQMHFNYIGNAYGDDEDKHGNRWLVLLGMRKFWSSPYAYGWGLGCVNPKYVAGFERNDPRRTHSIIDFNREGIAEKMDNGASGTFEDYLKDQREFTGYTIKKYTPTCYYDGTTTVPGKTGTGAVQEYQTQPYVILRYSDVLLMAAELGGVPAKSAQECLDEVRRRAYTDADGVLSPDYKQYSVSKETIMKERQAEFAFEAIRYWDLLRQGVDYAAGVIAEENTEVLTGNKAEYITIKAENIKAKRGLMQIPQNQITLSNGVLKQNAGW